MKVRQTFAVTLLGGALLGGCGDDEAATKDPAPTTTTATPNAQLAWVQEANTICRENNAKGEEINTAFIAKVNAVKAKVKAKQQVSDAELRAVKPKALVTTLISTERAFLERLRAVDVPAADETDWNGFIDRVGDALDLLPEAFDNSINDKADDPALVKKMSAIVADTRPYASLHGLDDCLPQAARTG